MANRRGYSLRLPPDLRRELKIFVAEHDSTMLEEIIAAIRYWIAMGGAPPGAPSREKPLPPEEPQEPQKGGGMLHKPADLTGRSFIMKSLLPLALIGLVGCASCPFTDAQGNYHRNEKWVGLNTIFPLFPSSLFIRPKLSCAEARAVGHPEWHRMETSLALVLIEKGELDKTRYIAEPKDPTQCPPGEKKDATGACYPKKSLVHPKP